MADKNDEKRSKKIDDELGNDEAIFLNQRSSPRISAELEVTVSGPHNFFTGFTQNVSQGGVFIATHQVFPIGTEFTIFLTIDSRKLEIAARVMWVREDTPFLPEGIAPGMGLSFTNLSEEDENLIQSFLKKKEPLFYDVN